MRSICENARIESFVHAIPVVIFEADTDCRLVTANRAFRDLELTGAEGAAGDGFEAQ